MVVDIFQNQQRDLLNSGFGWMLVYGGQEVVGSNPTAPTRYDFHPVSRSRP